MTKPYTPTCYSHRLNLAICETIQITGSDKSILTRVKKVSDFLIYLKHFKSLWKKIPISSFAPGSIVQKKKLVDVCRTRWVETVNGLDNFQDLFFKLEQK
jgi:hypothetical protein